MSILYGRPDPIPQNDKQQQQAESLYILQDQSLQIQQSSYHHETDKYNFLQDNKLCQPQMPNKLQVINQYPSNNLNGSNFENSAFQEKKVNINIDGGQKFKYMNGSGALQNELPMPYLNQKQVNRNKNKIKLMSPQYFGNDPALSDGGQLYCGCGCLCQPFDTICSLVKNCRGSCLGMCNECVDGFIANAGLCFDPLLNICQYGCECACNCLMCVLIKSDYDQTYQYI